MESVSNDPQHDAVELENTPPQCKPAINIHTGVINKSIYFLDPELTKCVIVGFAIDRGFSLGVIFKSKKGAVFLSHDTFLQFASHFNEVTAASEKKKEKYALSLNDFNVKVSNVFGRQHIFLYDRDNTLTLNSADWAQLVNNLPSLYRELRSRFLQEDLIISYIINILSSDEERVEAPHGLSPYLSDSVLDEVQLFKRWTNGGSS